MPPVSASQARVYCALPRPIRPRSLVRQAFRYSTAPSPRTTILPRWLTSKMPTESRTAACSLSTPAGYSSGISQPPNSANFAPSATWRSWSGDCFKDMRGSYRRHEVAERALSAGWPQLLRAGPNMTPRDDVHAAQGQPRQDPHRPGGHRRGPHRQGRPAGLPRWRGRRLGVRPQVHAAAQLDGLPRRAGRGPPAADLGDDQGGSAAARRPRRPRRADPGEGTPRRRCGGPQHRQRRLGRAGPARDRRRARARRRGRLRAGPLLPPGRAQEGRGRAPRSARCRSSATSRAARRPSRRWRRRAPSATWSTAPATG